MTAALAISPCPFCCGPPVPTCQSLDPRTGPVYKSKPFPEDGIFCEAYVFCHECGAQGPKASGEGHGGDFAFEAADVDRLEIQAVTLWNDRNARHLELFEYGARDGHNRYPRDYDFRPATPDLPIRARAMLAKLAEIAAECSECDGCGELPTLDTAGNPVGLTPCPDCDDIRGVIKAARGVA